LIEPIHRLFLTYQNSEPIFSDGKVFGRKVNFGFGKFDFDPSCTVFPEITYTISLYEIKKSWTINVWSSAFGSDVSTTYAIQIFEFRKMIAKMVAAIQEGCDYDATEEYVNFWKLVDEESFITWFD
jgi:hypothetical protein